MESDKKEVNLSAYCDICKKGVSATHSIFMYKIMGFRKKHRKCGKRGE